ncbi:hypothetical protein [Streptomyces cyaneofuscatus]|uniref:hypothetical protein n=1 Tax=Streptomyces cyaneofuscatus TaxID=66883 RepID=UPI0036B6B373
MNTSPGLQPVPGALVAEHGPDQLQRDRKGYLGPVVVAGGAGREEPAARRLRDVLLPRPIDRAEGTRPLPATGDLTAEGISTPSTDTQSSPRPASPCAPANSSP